MSKHTPEPWVFSDTNKDRCLILGGPHRKYVAHVQIYQTPREMGIFDEDERDANADLIVAAPTTLELLRRAEVVLNKLTSGELQMIDAAELSSQIDAHLAEIDGVKP